MIFNTYLTKQKKIQILVEAQLGHKMNIKENLMILENIKIVESFKIQSHKSYNIENLKLQIDKQKGEEKYLDCMPSSNLIMILEQ